MGMYSRERDELMKGRNMRKKGEGGIKKGKEEVNFGRRRLTRRVSNNACHVKSGDLLYEETPSEPRRRDTPLAG